ncbi:MAG TPA: tetratricopeptide repeat protein [Pyrinomonadaceae bacterium]|nr:tetratricopeptide repeat protein [Pyrinomonadaceae bacterium]
MKLTGIFLILFAIIVAGCGESQPDAPQVETEASNEVQQYTDAPTAVSEGRRFLDIGETEMAIDALNQAVKLDPDNADAYFYLGIAYALAEFSQQIAMENEGVPADTDSNDNSADKEKPNSVIAFERAVERYQKRIKANPEDHAAYYNLGRAYSKLNEDQDAAKALREAAELHPEETEYHTELGAVLIDLAKYHEAVAALKKALEVDPQNLHAEELLEQAEAGQKRITFTELPDYLKKKPEANSSKPEPSPESSPTEVPKATPAKPQPSPPAANRPNS